MAVIELDLSGLKCPLPALRTRKTLSRMKPGDRLHVRCTDPMAAIDIPHLVNESGHALIESVFDGPALLFTIAVNSI